MQRLLSIGLLVAGLLGVGGCITTLHQQENDPRTLVRTEAGLLRGAKKEDGSVVFRGVRFAEAPIKQLRFAPPQAVKPWRSVKDARTSGAPCVQNDYGWNKDLAATGSEDCLFLEVRTHHLNQFSAKKPVMVFIHGGANRAGAGKGVVESQLGENKDLVLVSVQYRLGVFGFASHPALSAESGGASGNYALMDIVAALRWVRANIAQFGGDPDNVMIFGHSAGGQDTGLMLVTPSARGLFHKAALQSGTPQFGYAARTLAQNEALGVDLTKGFTRHDPASKAALNDLRAADANALQKAGDKLQPPINDAGFIWDQPTVDGKVLPRAPDDILAAGEAAKVPVIIGISAKEFGLYGGESAFDATLTARFGPKAAQVLPLYEATPPELGNRALALSDDLMFRCPALWLAESLTRSGNAVYFYQLETDQNAKVQHGSEWPFVFDHPRPLSVDSVWPPMGAYWRALSATGAPTVANQPAWPQFGADGHYLAFTPKGIETRQGLRSDICPHLLERHS